MAFTKIFVAYKKNCVNQNKVHIFWSEIKFTEQPNNKDIQSP